jgi:class 3 adenylate cyclase
MSISMGLYNGAEYLIVPSSITSMIIFKNFRIILFYFFFNAIAFVLCKFSFTAIEPFLVMPIKEGLYIPNQFLMFTILFLIVYYFKSENLRQEKLLETQNMSLAMEQQKSEKLLLNILPRETAEELKHTGAARSRQFDSVTILFSDFKNFTLASERMSPEELVNEIHRYFSYFDSIMEKYGLEKIKTIGDAYMCAGGIPDENTTHASDVIRAAIDMQQYVANLKKEKIAAGEIFFEIRIGIHTGPVVAGIVGTKKFAYDVWGDTVNLASRMESSGEVGRVNISATTYKLVKDSFPCEYRGKVSAKNKGEIDMYFVVV